MWIRRGGECYLGLGVGWVEEIGNMLEREEKGSGKGKERMKEI